MEIQMLAIQSYFEKVMNGSITALRLPGMEAEAGTVLTAAYPPGDNNVITLKVLASETVPLEAITVEEAEQEGFADPGFCASQFLCGNIATRLDFEDYAFKQEDGVPLARSREEQETYLREKVQELCPSCLVRKDAKDQFLRYWKSKAVEGNMTKIRFEVVTS